MTSILDGELADTLVDALNIARIPQTLNIVRRVVDPNSPPWDPTSVEATYSCSGWVDTYTATEIGAGAVQASDRKAFVICSSLAVTPLAGDHVVIDSVSYSIMSVQRDPAGACWVIQARR